MGMLIEECWSDVDRVVEGGAYKRPPSRFAEDLGPDIIESIRSEPGRYHLVASMSCPWSHRAIVVRQIKGLERFIALQLAGGPRVEGYAVNFGRPWRVPGSDRSIVHLHELYTLSDPSYSGRVTVPVLWDMKDQRIVSNDSAKIMRAFDAVPNAGTIDYTLRPADLAAEIEAVNLQIYNGLSNAVYRAGFAEHQDAYDEAVTDVFKTLDVLAQRLATRRYLHGSVITESDWRLFPSLVRFDAVYHILFRCARLRLVDQPHLWAYARDLYGWAGVSRTVDFDAIRAGAYFNDNKNNPYGIVAVAPEMDWLAPHGRERMGPALVTLRCGGTAEIEPSTLRPI